MQNLQTQRAKCSTVCPCYIQPRTVDCTYHFPVFIITSRAAIKVILHSYLWVSLGVNLEVELLSCGVRTSSRSIKKCQIVTKELCCHLRPLQYFTSAPISVQLSPCPNERAKWYFIFISICSAFSKGGSDHCFFCLLASWTFSPVICLLIIFARFSIWRCVCLLLICFDSLFSSYLWVTQCFVAK